MTEPWCNKLAEYEVVAESDSRRVVMLKSLAKEYKKLKHKDKAGLLRWIQIWCDDQQAGAIPREKFKKQDNYRNAEGKSIAVYCFKFFQGRLYGFSRIVEKKETFLISAIDPAKKNDDADQNLLARAKEEGFRVLKVLGIR